MPDSDLRSRLARSLSPRALLRFEQHFDWRITGRWMLYSVVVGVAGALAAIVFSTLLDWVAELALIGGVGYANPLPGGEGSAAFDLQRALHPTHRWALFLVPTLGGLVSGWLVFTFAPEAEGHGTDAVIRSFHRERGIIRPRVPLVKTLASAITIGTGGSAGREGPIAHIGAAFGSLLGLRLGLSTSERRILLVAGIAAGIGAIFRSPLGGAFFAVEVLYREDLEHAALMPAAVAGITGYSVYSSLENSASVFTVDRFQFVNPLELVPLVLFALVCAVVGILYVRVFYGVRNRLFAPMPIPRMLKPAVGGLLLGALAFAFPPILGSSYGWLQQAIDGNLPLTLMAMLAVLKILSTSVTIGSGGSGGVFAPSLVIGGMLGGLFGEGLHALAPNLAAQPEAYVMIGMATFFTGVANVPISTTIMISEMTGSYTLLVPLLFAGVLAHLVARRWSLYTEQVRTTNDSPAHRLDLTPDLLATVSVGSLVNRDGPFHTLEPSHTLPEMLSVFTRTREVVLPVATPPGDGAERRPHYTGLVLLDNLQSMLSSNEVMQHLIVAQDVEVPFESVRETDTLDVVLKVFLDTQYPELPVVDGGGAIVGFVRQGQVIDEYYRAYLKRQQEEVA